jgi:general secretion pathway protein L
MATALNNRIQQWRTRVQVSPVGQFFKWWIGELSGMLPAGWRARLSHSRRRVLLRVTGGELDVMVQDGDALHSLGHFPLEQDLRLQNQQIRDLLLEHELAELRRDALLDDANILSKPVFMPLATESNLNQALAYEMDRQTPFRADDVYFDFRLLDRDKDQSQIKLDLVVTPRKPVDDIVELLRRRGLAPTGVDVLRSGRPAGINLLPPADRFRLVNRRLRFNLALGFAVVVLAGLVMAQSLYFRGHQLRSLEEQIATVREQAMEVQRVRGQIDDASEAAGFLIRKRLESVPAVIVLAEATRILPDDTFLDRLLVGQGRIQMQGKSNNAQRLIELVNQSDQFNDASFRGPTRLDSRSQKEIFDLSAAIGPGGAD